MTRRTRPHPTCHSLPSHPPPFPPVPRRRPYRAGLPGVPPPLLLPYPELAGKLTYPDNRLLPAQCGAGVGLVTGALARLAAEEPRVEALYRVLDRCV